MVKGSYNKKVVKKDYSNKFTDLERKIVRNKVRDFINKTDIDQLLQEVYKSCITYGMKK